MTEGMGPAAMHAAGKNDQGDSGHVGGTRQKGGTGAYGPSGHKSEGKGTGNKSEGDGKKSGKPGGERLDSTKGRRGSRGNG